MTSYKIPVFKVELVRESTLTVSSKTIDKPEIAVEIMHDYFARQDREHVVVLMLNIKNKVIGINTAHIGSINSCCMAPPEIFKPAILCNAAAIVLMHNHPSGDKTPSAEDIGVTKRIAEAGKMLGITVLDHIVIGDGFYSFKEYGLL